MSKGGSGRLGQSKWLIVGALVVAILMGVGRIGSGLIDQSSPGPTGGPDCTEAIAWDDAIDHVGSQETIRGPVAGARYVEDASGQPTFLNLGRDFPDPDRFTVVIWNDVRIQFDQDPEMLFDGQEICVAGEIAMHEGSPQIVLDGPGAIQYAD